MHPHDPDAAPRPLTHTRAFQVGVGLNSAFIVVEILFGLATGSLALLADAGHNLSDVVSLLLAWGAAVLAARPARGRRTYGWRRASILAALTNALILLVGVGAIAWEAIVRFRNPAPVPAVTVMAVAGIGVVINGFTAWLFVKGRKDDLNIRGAFLHLLSDAGVSVGVVGAGLILYLTGWSWVDPAISLLIAIAIVVGTWGLLRDSVNLSLDVAPAVVDLPGVRHYLEGLPDVLEVHDLHVWGMSTSETALTAHLIRSDPQVNNSLLRQARRDLLERFQIHHVTLQLEADMLPHPCDPEQPASSPRP